MEINKCNRENAKRFGRMRTLQQERIYTFLDVVVLRRRPRTQYNDSKMHSKMDINYKSFSSLYASPPLKPFYPVAVNRYTAVAAGRISRTFWAFWCTSRICQTGRRRCISSFNPHKKNHDHTRNISTSSVPFHFFFSSVNILSSYFRNVKR